ncbi:MAG: methyltransferase domain-containing protein [Desulfovibrio sp.]|nr:methyltransferase domain-containing protein [Desulfovibrio sp.]
MFVQLRPIKAQAGHIDDQRWSVYVFSVNQEKAFPSEPSQSAVLARAVFPRGLEQPDGSLRFGLDALLLAAFAARHAPMPQGRSLWVADLGCGCGAALLALALQAPCVCGLGLDREEELVLAARRNALRLGLDDRLHFALGDLADVARLRKVIHPVYAACALGRLDVALANPPFDIAGRSSPHTLREKALRVGSCGEAAVKVFCRAAAALLRHHGHCFCIWPASTLPRLCAALDMAGLGLRYMLPVQTRPGQSATRVLVAARKNAAHDMELHAPLLLHGPGQGWTAAALEFCPHLF